jgi:hypothetical protein
VYAQGKVSIHGWDIAARTIVVLAVRGWRNGVIVDDIVQTDHRAVLHIIEPRNNVQIWTAISRFELFTETRGVGRGPETGTGGGRHGWRPVLEDRIGF